MRNQMIPTEELEKLIGDLNNQLDALEVKLSEAIEREHAVLINGKIKEIDEIQKQCNGLRESVSRYRGTAVKQSAFMIQPKYSV